MKRQSVIIMLLPGQRPICRGNFKKLCLEFSLPYHSLKSREFPISWKEAVIYRVPFG
jgi:hypothetical protein